MHNPQTGSSITGTPAPKVGRGRGWSIDEAGDTYVVHKDGMAAIRPDGQVEPVIELPPNPHHLAARIRAFHARNTGSNPVGGRHAARLRLQSGRHDVRLARSAGDPRAAAQADSPSIKRLGIIRARYRGYVTGRET